MGTSSWHINTLPSETQQALNVLRDFKYIQNTKFFKQTISAIIRNTIIKS